MPPRPEITLRFVLVLLSSLLLEASVAVPRAEAKRKSTPSKGIRRIELKKVRTIVIDPGHGGDNLGTRSIYGVLEKRITLRVALKLAAHLRETTRARVLLTRESDKPLSLRERIEFANRAGADVFLSLHCNSDPKHRGTGIETFFLSLKASDAEALKLAHRENGAELFTLPVQESPNEIQGILTQLQHVQAHTFSFHLATAILAALVKETKWRNRGVKQAPFGVLRHAQMPAIVVEMGFLSHPDEAKKLLDDAVQERIAAALVRGIELFDKKIR
ncbi:MAG: N-acetylmuramoyl-L-alanine amidase [Myxococcales bacterium]|nr:N-acetylmuramoyl-L-alanine amidase [Myxococcales bacterium]